MATERTLHDRFGPSWAWVHVLLETIRHFGKKEWEKMKSVAQHLQGDQLNLPNQAWRMSVNDAEQQAIAFGQFGAYISASAEVMQTPNAPSESALLVLAELAGVLALWHKVQPLMMRQLLRSLLPERPFRLNGEGSNSTQRLQAAAAMILDNAWADAEVAEELVGREMMEALLNPHMAGLETEAKRRASLGRD